MALTDTFTGDINLLINPRIVTAEGSIKGNRSIAHKIIKRLTDGSGSLQATGFFGSTFTATTGGVTISLADSADPLGAAGDDSPTTDPEGLKLRLLLIENLDSTNFISVKRGTNGETSMLSGGTDSIKIVAGGFNLWFSPAGDSAMNDGVDDEILVTSNSASVSVKLTYIFG